MNGNTNVGKTRLDQMELLRSGWLYKQVGGLRKSWQKRWFALTENGRLVYFKTQAPTAHARGVFYLSDCRMACDRGGLWNGAQKGNWPPNVDHRLCFALDMHDKLVCLYAQTKEECWAWVKALEKSRLECPSPPPAPSPPPSPIEKSFNLGFEGGAVPPSPSTTTMLSRESQDLDGSTLSMDDFNTGIRLTSSASSLSSQTHTQAPPDPSPPSLPTHVLSNIQQSLLLLNQSLGNINASTGVTFSFICDLAKIYNNVPPTVSKRDEMGSIIYGKYLSALSLRVVADLAASPVIKATFLERLPKRQIHFKLGQSPFASPLSPLPAVWIQEGVLFLSVPNFHFGKHALDVPSIDRIPVVGLDDLPESGASDFFAETAWQDTWEAGQIDLLPSRVKEDIYDAVHLLEGSLQAISRAAQRSFRFECEFDVIYMNLPDDLENRKYIGSVVYGEYLLPLSVAIVKYCEDPACRERFLSHVYNHRIVFSLHAAGSEIQNTTITYRNGTLHVIVSPLKFGCEQFRPDLTLLSMRPADTDEATAVMAAANGQIICSRLPPEIQQDIHDATPFLVDALDSLAEMIGEEFTFECNFEEVWAAAKTSLRNRNIPGSTVYANYLKQTCRSINDYLRLDLEGKRAQLLERLHRRQIVFSCAQPPASVTRRGEEKKAVAFTHRGVLHVMCPGSEFGKEIFEMDVARLLALPDEEDLVFGLGGMTSELLQGLLGKTGCHRTSGSLSRTSSGCSTWTNGSGDFYMQPSSLVVKKC